MATLYILEQGATLNLRDACLVVRKGEQVLQEIPALHVRQIVIFGNAVLTTPTVRFALEKGIDVTFLSYHGVYRGRLQPACSHDAAVRQAQYERAADRHFCQQLARQFVCGKLVNMATLLNRQRSERRGRKVAACVKRLRQLLSAVRRAPTLDALRGYEGSASRSYFEALASLLKPELGFQGRRHRPAPDPVNALLSLGYTLLYNHVYSWIHLAGLDPYRGFFHQLKRGHASLASDLMEEWRPIIVDSLVLSLVNRGDLGPKDFRTGQGRAHLTRQGLKHFLSHYEKTLRREIVHPQRGERLDYRRCIELQVRHFAHVLTGSDPRYVPFNLG